MLRHKLNGRRDLIRSDVSEHRGGRVMAGICLLDRMHVGDSEKRKENEKNVFFLEWDKEADRDQHISSKISREIR